MITVEEARAYYQDNDSAHGFDHVLRVWHMAEQIGRAEGADLELLQAATLLHDVSRAEAALSGGCHAQLGAARAQEILAGQPLERVERVAEIIRQHRFRDNVRPTSIEAQVLYDADKLDAIGAIGIARAYAIAGVYRQRLWADVGADYASRPRHLGHNDLDSEEHTPVHEYQFKLAKLKDTLFTVSGTNIAAARHEFMVSFFERLEAEVAGKL